MGNKGPKSEFTGIQFSRDALYGTPAQLFMSRDNEPEVAIPRAEKERWAGIEVADGTNRAFVTVYDEPPKTTNGVPGDPHPYWWPMCLVEMTLPMPDQPLSNYTLRTVWTCPTRDEVKNGDLIPMYIDSTWDGRYLSVYSRIYNADTNAAERRVTCIFDVAQGRWLNPP